MDDILKYWGKTAKKNEDGVITAWHPVLYHCLDCAAVAKVWLDTSTGITRALGVDKHREITSWILFFIYMHDYGKLSVRFQSLCMQLWNSLQPDAINDTIQRSAPSYQHGTEGEYLFYQDNQIDEYNVCEWMRVAGDHHHRCKDGLMRAQFLPQRNSSLDLNEIEIRKNFTSIGQELFIDGFMDIDSLYSQNSPPNTFKGFCTVCDWIASDPDFFPFIMKDISPADYFDSRLRLAEVALRQCGLLHSTPIAYGMSGLFPEYKPRGVQKITFPTGGDYSLAVIEAPTGSGKTEEALAIASEWLAHGKADSILFALPTQATANSMFDRLQNIAPKLFAGDSNVVLAHGKSKFNKGFKQLLENGRNINGEGNEGLLQCSEWLSTSKKRAFFGQIGVCTIDQVLIGALPIRHNFVRTFGVGRSVLIVDEVHAYDSYMNELLDKVLKEQKECNGPTILLSATLPIKRRKELIEKWTGKKQETLSLEYPLSTFADVNGIFCEQTPDDKEEEKKVFFESHRTIDALPDDNLLEEIVEYAKKGFAVAVICNLVADAQNTWERIKRIAGPLHVDLFHSRYSFYDREKIEIDVISRYGKGREEGKGAIIVATQVVEQSLDLDFDFMVTQICPVELLFQRLGRLYRHERKTRPDTTARCIVLSPEGDNFKLHELIYGNQAHLWRTRELIEREPEVTFPEIYRKWIESMYEKFENESPSITSADEQWHINTMGKKYTAQQISNMDPKDLSDAFVSALTRDGDMNMNLLPVDSNGSLLDSEKTIFLKLQSDNRNIGASEVVQLQSIPCPGSWFNKLGNKVTSVDGFAVITVDSDGPCWTFTGSSEKMRLNYSPTKGLEKERCYESAERSMDTNY